MSAVTFRRILDDARAARRAGRRPVVVFDLDSTLIHTGARHLAIARAFAAEVRPLPLDGLTAADFGWTVDGPLGELDPATRAALRAFWEPRFFAGDWLHHDLPAAGAVAFVRRAVEAGAVALYLTGRPAPEMGPQTVASLHRLGFPVFEARAALHMKPSARLDDAVFKRAATHEVNALGEVIATFENEPAHANHFAATWPAAAHVLVGDVCSPGAPPPSPEVVRVADFLPA